MNRPYAAENRRWRAMGAMAAILRGPGRRRRWAVAVVAILVAALAPVWPQPGRSKPTVSLESRINLSNTVNQLAESPQVVATSNGTLHVVWEAPDEVYGSPTIFHRYKRPGSGVWLPASPIKVARGAREPALATDGSQVAVAFRLIDPTGGNDTEIHYLTWDDTLSAWSTEFYPRQGSLNHYGIQPALAFDPLDKTVIWMMWIDASHTPPAPVLARLHNHRIEGGTTLGDVTAPASLPRLAITPEGKVWATWLQDDGGASGLEYGWLEPGRSPSAFAFGTGYLSWYKSDQLRAPDIAADADDVCAVWQEAASVDVTAPQEIVQACQLWKDPEELSFDNVSNSQTNSLKPRLAMAGALGPLVVWQERTPPQKQIRFRQGVPPHTDTVNEGKVDWPALAYEFSAISQTGYVHSVWTEETATGADVYYGRWAVNMPATPTPTAGPSSTPTGTPTPAATELPTVTVTATPLDGPSPTATRRPPTPTRTRTATRTPTPSRTPTPTATNTVPPTATVSEATPTPITPVITIYCPMMWQRLAPTPMPTPRLDGEGP